MAYRSANGKSQDLEREDKFEPNLKYSESDERKLVEWISALTGTQPQESGQQVQCSVEVVRCMDGLWTMSASIFLIFGLHVIAESPPYFAELFLILEENAYCSCRGSRPAVCRKSN